ncbi:MAG: hypothetical protein Q9176_001158 [Flavoplaca citrina]
MNRQATRSSLFQITSTVRLPRLCQASPSGHVRALHLPPCTLKPNVVNIAALSAFHDHPASLRLESFQLFKDFRAYTTKADGLEAADGLANSHKKESVAFGNSKIEDSDSGKSDLVTMAKRNYDARAREKAKRFRPVWQLLVIYVIVPSLFYAWAVDRTIRDSEGNKIEELGPIDHFRCKFFLQGEKSLQEFARAEKQYIEEQRRQEEEKAEMDEGRRLARMKKERETVYLTVRHAGMSHTTTTSTPVTEEDWNRFLNHVDGLIDKETERNKSTPLKYETPRQTRSFDLY